MINFMVKSIYFNFHKFIQFTLSPLQGFEQLYMGVLTQFCPPVQQFLPSTAHYQN